MCGIVGFISLEGSSRSLGLNEYIKRGLIVDTVRGKDSTGIACVSGKEGDECIVHKKAINGADFVDLGKTQGLLDAKKFNAIIGHNRAATMGTVNAGNAHPFSIGNITLVHNGTLDSWEGLDKDYDVDSEAICAAMNEDNPKKVLETIEGAFALVWHDRSDNTIHFARNEDRPFVMALSASTKTMFFASAAWILEAAVPAGFTVTIKSLPVGKHLTYKLDELDLSKPLVEEFTPQENWAHYYYNNYATPRKNLVPTTPKKHVPALIQAGYEQGEYLQFYATDFRPYSKDNSRGSLYGYTIGETYEKYNISDAVVSYNVHESVWKSCHAGDGALLQGTARAGHTCKDGMFEITLDDICFVTEDEEDDDSSETMTLKEFNDATKHGCLFCGDPVFYEDIEEMDWTDDGRPVCPKCSTAMEEVKDASIQ